MKKILWFTYVVFTFGHLNAQEFKLGDVSSIELEEKYSSVDSSANAAYLLNKGKLSVYYNSVYGWGYEIEVLARIKIYNKEGYDSGTVEIPLYIGGGNNNKEEISKLKAITYNLDGKKIIKSKVNKKNISYSQTKYGWENAVFTFPNLREGSVLEYMYTIRSPYFTVLPEWKFQQTIPTKESIYEFNFPKIFGYNERFKGYQKIKKDVKDIPNYNVGSYLYGNGMRFIYKATNVPEIAKESFVNNYDNYISSVQHELAVAKITNDGKLADLLTSWDKVAKELDESKNFGKQLRNTRYFKKNLDTLATDHLSEMEKIEVIFNLIKEKVTWNKRIGISCSDVLDIVYEEGTGNVADMNIMLTSMLNYIGLDADPVILSTINNGFPPSIPSTHFYNYIVSSVTLEDGSEIFLDVSDPNAAPNVLPTRCLNFMGIKFLKNLRTKKVDLFPNYISKENNFMNLEVDENGIIIGKVRRQFTKQTAYIFRQKYRDLDKEQYLEKLENTFNISIHEYDCKNLNTPNKPILETISFTSNDKQDVINNKIFLSPLLFFTTTTNPFKEEVEDRQLPLNFTFPKSTKYAITIEYPEGFEVDYIPNKINDLILDKRFSYNSEIKAVNDKKLQIMVNQNINTSILEVDYYAEVKDFFDTIVKNEAEKIVLTKK